MIGGGAGLRVADGLESIVKCQGRPKWRNWQTHQTQNLALVTQRGGSTPPFGTSMS